MKSLSTHRTFCTHRRCGHFIQRAWVSLTLSEDSHKQLRGKRCVMCVCGGLADFARQHHTIHNSSVSRLRRTRRHVIFSVCLSKQNGWHSFSGARPTGVYPSLSRLQDIAKCVLIANHISSTLHASSHEVTIIGVGMVYAGWASSGRGPKPKTKFQP